MSGGPVGILRRCHCLSTNAGAEGATREFDATQPSFNPDQSTCEAVSPAAALQHFGGREIKFRSTASLHLPTSYADHYPPKAVHGQTCGSRPQQPESGRSGALFSARSEYTREYPEKPLIQQRAVQPGHFDLRPVPAVSLETTHGAHYQPWALPEVPHKAWHQKAITPLPLSDLAADSYVSTSAAHYVPKRSSHVRPTGTTQVQPLSESQVKVTSYDDHYCPKPVGRYMRTLRPAQPMRVPLDGRTTYDLQFTPKALPRELPHLAGIKGSAGLRLPVPRQSLGVQIAGNSFFVLLPYSVCAPCSARQIFSTVHDNQSEACINILYGQGPRAEDSRLVGQFDITGIPPAPKGEPQIEVTFSLSKDMVLSVEGRDLDSGRHKLWQQAGGTVAPRLQLAE